jgi:hypothetical protein
VPALTGAIMCMGVATANSVLVISFARERYEELGDPVAAALEAGFVRFRPVLMTALAMIIGMLPMALGLGEGGEQNAPLGRAVIGGLIFATIATLMFVPVVFSMVHKKQEGGITITPPLVLYVQGDTGYLSSIPLFLLSYVSVRHDRVTVATECARHDGVTVPTPHVPQDEVTVARTTRRSMRNGAPIRRLPIRANCREIRKPARTSPDPPCASPGFAARTSGSASRAAEAQRKSTCGILSIMICPLSLILA